MFNDLHQRKIQYRYFLLQVLVLHLTNILWCVEVLRFNVSLIHGSDINYPSMVIHQKFSRLT